MSNEVLSCPPGYAKIRKQKPNPAPEGGMIAASTSGNSHGARAVIYLYGYLGIGAVVLAVLFVWRRRTSDDESESLRDLLEVVNPNRRTRSYRIRRRIVTPVLTTVAFMVLWAVWPLAVYLRVVRFFSDEDAIEEDMEREFAVEPVHLQVRLTLEEIEAQEMVDDPLDAVPNVPFGHLNAAWRTFLESQANSDELWSFTAPWRTWLLQPELRAGYALVRNGIPVTHFLTVCKILPEEKENSGDAAGGSCA